MTWEATILDSSPRAADWQRVFGDRTVPVTSPLPVRAELPGRGLSDVYLLDLAAVGPETRERLVRHIAEQFQLPPADVERDLDAQGMPLLAEDVYVPIPLRFLVGDDLDDEDDRDAEDDYPLDDEDDDDLDDDDLDDEEDPIDG